MTILFQSVVTEFCCGLTGSFFPLVVQNLTVQLPISDVSFDEIQRMPTIVLDHEEVPVDTTGRNPCRHGAYILVYVLKESFRLL